MNNRIKEVRKDHHLTQVKFGERIGMKQNSIAQLEMGKFTPSDIVIQSICREFGVHREWLENGRGPMYREKPAGGIEKEIQDILGVDDPFAVAVLASLAKMPPQFWDIWREELYKAVEAQKKNSD